jgi:hypothetical protein
MYRAAPPPTAFNRGCGFGSSTISTLESLLLAVDFLIMDLVSLRGVNVSADPAGLTVRQNTFAWQNRLEEAFDKTKP